MPHFESFTIDEVLFYHTGILVQSDEIRMDGVLNQSSLEAALAAPDLTFNKQEIYPGTVTKIGALMFEIITLHPFIEGNKRTGFLLADMLMIMNGRIMTGTDDERTAIAMSVARLETDRDALITWLEEHSFLLIDENMYYGMSMSDIAVDVFKDPAGSGRRSRKGKRRQ